MYLERRIQAAIHGDAEFDFSAILGWKALGNPHHCLSSQALKSLLTRVLRGRCEAFRRQCGVHQAHYQP